MIAADPHQEIRLLSTRSISGANFWSTFPVTRLDLSVGAFDEISSAERPGLTDALVAALPGLVEHRCSIGERGGFITRLRRGTYAPHIVEHVALELQSMLGHDVGYGRARGGDRDGEYTVVVQHRHAAVGSEAGEAAVDLVRRAFAGDPVDTSSVLERLREVSRTPNRPAPTASLRCGITGGGDLTRFQDALAASGIPFGGTSALSPLEILRSGLPYARSETAIIANDDPGEVPRRYLDAERAARLLAVVADAVPPNGIVAVPGKAWEVQDIVREAGRRVAVFSTGGKVTSTDARVAQAVATIQGEEIVIECDGCDTQVKPLSPAAPPDAQVTAALAAWILRSTPAFQMLRRA